MKGLPGFIRRQIGARPLAVFSVCFLFGLLLGNACRIPVVVTSAALITAILFRIILIRKRCALLLMLCGMLLGILRIEIAFNANPLVPESFSVEFSGRVVSEPTLNKDGDRIVCAFRLCDLNGEESNALLKLYLRSDQLPLEGVAYGQTLTCFGHVWPPDHATNPYQFDLANWLLTDGMTGMAAAKMEDIRVITSSRDFGSLIIDVRKAITDRIRLLFPENDKIVTALVLGDRSSLDAEIQEAFNQTGVAHLLCISGLHISALAFAVAQAMSLFVSYRKSVFITLTAVLMYGILIGFPPSMVRAAVMYAVFSFAPLTGRPSDPITRLSFALLSMLLFKPFYIYDGGFILSFAASAGIILLVPPLEKLFFVDRLKDRKFRILLGKAGRLLKRVVLYFPQLFCATLAAQVATLPVVIACFGSQPLISVLSNLIAVPLLITAYYAALIALLLSLPVMSLGIPLAYLADSVFTLLQRAVMSFAQMNVGGLHAPEYPFLLLLLHYALIVAASGLSRLSHRIKCVLPVLIVSLLFVSMIISRLSGLGFQAIFLDAGQADSAVVRAEGKVYLFDVGDEYTPADDYISSACTGIDAVFLSHADYDHAGGIESVLRSATPGVIYVPSGWSSDNLHDTVARGMALADEAGIPVIKLTAGDVLQLSKNVIAEIWAPSDAEKESNDMSMVVHLKYYDDSILFTGDLPIKLEPDILPDSDVLKVPHHGSAYACSANLLNQVSPEISVISVGENSYGHPTAETLARLNDANTAIYRTDQCGAITVRMNGKGSITVKTFLPAEE